MALPTKIDFIGLATTGLELRSNDLGKSATYLEKNGHNGDIVASDMFGIVCAPTCEYLITAAIENFKRKLGKVYATAGSTSPITGPIALRSFSVSTSASGEPTLSASGVQIEAGATSTACTYETGEIDLSQVCHALTFGAFSYTESSTLALESCTYTAEANIIAPTINGVPKSSDAVAGKETVTATFWSANGQPTVEAADGWVMSSPLTCTGNDGDMETWECAFTHHLESEEAE